MTATPGAGSLVVRGGRVLGPEPDGWRTGDVVVDAGRIVATPFSPAPANAPDGGTVFDASGLLVAPGLVDLQCNGAGGIDLTTEPERLWEVAALLPQWGVTSWLPTVVTAPADVRRRAITTLAGGPAESAPRSLDHPSRSELAAAKAEPAAPGTEGRRHADSSHRADAEPARGTPGGIAVGATPLGLHVEGPFLSPECRGAHRLALLREPDLALVEAEGWSRDRGVALVTLAPELPGAVDLIRALVDRGVVVSLGHSAATADQATAAVDAGATWVTHLFNGMTSLHHREPGLAGVALTDERLRVGVIADGIHLHPTTVALAARALGPRLTLVTDAMAALGAPPGRLMLGDLEASVNDGEVRLPDGTLAGSTLSLDQAVRNLAVWTHVGIEAALRAATQVPAAVLGLGGERGVVAPGAAGDLAIFQPRDGSGSIELVATIIGGTVALNHTRRCPPRRW